MRQTIVGVFSFAVVLVSPIAAQPAPRRAIAIESALAVAVGRVQWPGYAPLSIPLAIYDGDSTYLFRHPAPPSTYHSTADAWAVMSGRDPNITANSSATIGGVVSATLMIDRATAPFDATAWAAVAMHEAFHVFQRTHHASWVGNEGDLLIYPFENASRLALRRLESDALRRAEGSSSAALSRCWTREFVRARQSRYASLDSAFRWYERKSELNEGLANYVQVRAGAKRVNPLVSTEFAAEAVRDRVYATGPALGVLLDRFSPEWKAALERDDSQNLDDLLDRATRTEDSAPPSVARCGFSLAERMSASARARRDSMAIVARRDSLRRAFESRTGWRIVVQAADGAPLWPQGFDPSNVSLVRGGLLHSRFLKLGNALGELEVLRSATAMVEALTEAAGAHPLFNGVRRVEIMLPGAPQIDTENDSVRIAADGLTLRLNHATVVRDAQRVSVTLQRQPR